MARRPALARATRRDLPCYMLHTTDATREVVMANLDKSPMYSGVIKGIGTRYCPSFEDKVVRYPQHPYHLLIKLFRFFFLIKPQLHSVFTFDRTLFEV